MPTRRKVLSIGCALGGTALLRNVALAQVSTKPLWNSATDPLAFVNAEFRPAAEQLAKEGPVKPLSAENLKAHREFMEQLASPILPTPSVTERTIPGPPGAPPVRLFVVGDSPDNSKPAILHMHHGGYVAGSAAASRREIQDLSVAHDCVAVSVEYRLAPETTFPGALEDNYAALRWLYENSKQLGIDTKRIAIMGESAGGGHAAALAIAARDRGEVPICLQILIYPMLDDRTSSSKTMPPFLGHYIWTPESNRFAWASFLGVPPGTARVPRNSVPARISDLNGLPPAFIGVGSIDLLAPESIEYAQRLVAAGVAVELNVVPGGFHAFNFIAPDASLSRQFERAWNEALRRAFSKS